jgi:DNA polymerase
MRLEYSAGVFAYRREKGRTLVLYLKRPIDYDVPKGHIEKGEDAEAAAHRELREETGIDADFLPYFVEDTTHRFRRGDVPVLKEDKFFIGRARAGRVRISDEHTGYEWLDLKGVLEKERYENRRRFVPRLFDYIDRYERMDELNADYARLPGRVAGWKLSRRLVPGDGPLDAEAVLLGEAPGAREDELRRPFVGRSGALLGRVLQKAGLRREDFYITSVVQFRPPENRLPKSHEIAACRGFLEGQLDIVRPKIVVLLGRTASAAVLGLDRMAELHGRVFERDGTKYFVTYHPAAALRSTTNLKTMTRDLERLKRLLSAK